MGSLSLSPVAVHRGSLSTVGTLSSSPLPGWKLQKTACQQFFSLPMKWRFSSESVHSFGGLNLIFTRNWCILTCAKRKPTKTDVVKESQSGDHQNDIMSGLNKARIFQFSMFFICCAA
eukprot:Gb_06262 [translate_table: standard]